MKIATFNLRNLFDVGWQNSGDGKIIATQEFVDKVVDSAGKTINSIGPDILVAQEIGSEKLFNEIAKGQINKYKTFIAKPDARGIANGAMFSIPAEGYSVEDVTGFPVFVENQEDNIGKSISSYRQFVHIKTLYNNKPLHLFGVHLKAFSGIQQKSVNGEKLPICNQCDAGDALIRALIYRLAQARHLREIIDELFAEDTKAQIIVLGDFNATEGQEILSIIKGKLENVDTQLDNACELIAKEKRYSHIWHGEKLLIDHILISKNLKKKVIKLEIMNEAIVDQSELSEYTFYESDHAPVVLTLI